MTCSQAFFIKTLLCLKLTSLIVKLKLRYDLDLLAKQT